VSAIATLTQLSDALAEVVAGAGRSIVAVNARRRLPSSGLVWSDDGTIVTADHGIERDEEITITAPDGADLPAQLIGRDPGTDIAVLKAEAQLLTPASFATDARVGALAVAVGRPGAALMASLGVIASAGRDDRTGRGGTLEDYYRTDATALPGFSGGALVLASGGIAAMLTSHLGQGAGFAIGPATLRRVVGDLQRQGRVRRAYIGVTSQPVALPVSMRDRHAPGQEAALLVVGLEADGPADRAGLLLGDVVILFGGEPIRDTGDLQTALRADRIGQAIAIRVIRGGEARDLTVTVGERPT